jgi:hypothetical protein
MYLLAENLEAFALGYRDWKSGDPESSWLECRRKSLLGLARKQSAGACCKNGT